MIVHVVVSFRLHLQIQNHRQQNVSSQEIPAGAALLVAAACVHVYSPVDAIIISKKIMGSRINQPSPYCDSASSPHKRTIYSTTSAVCTRFIAGALYLTLPARNTSAPRSRLVQINMGDEEMRSRDSLRVCSPFQPAGLDLHGCCITLDCTMAFSNETVNI